jgi:hypothetical protein
MKDNDTAREARLVEQKLSRELAEVRAKLEKRIVRQDEKIQDLSNLLTHVARKVAPGN